MINPLRWFVFGFICWLVLLVVGVNSIVNHIVGVDREFVGPVYRVTNEYRVRVCLSVEDANRLGKDREVYSGSHQFVEYGRVLGDVRDEIYRRVVKLEETMVLCEPLELVSSEVEKI